MGLEEDMDGEGQARDMDDENEEETNLVDVASDKEEAVEAVSSNDPQEIARFNNYMDAIYRRMNAALRAKLMDPMVLNMNAKVAKEDEVDRMGEVEEPEEDKEAKKMARKEKKKKKKNKKDKKERKEKKEGKKPLSAEKLKKKDER